jgi:hypothetical protein
MGHISTVIRAAAGSGQPRFGVPRLRGSNWSYPPEGGTPNESDSPPAKPREEAVQGAGMWGPFHAQGAAESDESVRLRVRSHVPGTRRNRAQAEEAGIKKAKP